VLPNEDEEEEEIRIPIHRILQITNVKTEQIFYHRSVGKEDSLDFSAV